MLNSCDILSLNFLAENQNGHEEVDGQEPLPPGNSEALRAVNVGTDTRRPQTQGTPEIAQYKITLSSLQATVKYLLW